MLLSTKKILLFAYLVITVSLVRGSPFSVSAQYEGTECYETYCRDCFPGSIINGLYFGGTGGFNQISLPNDPYTMTGDILQFDADLKNTITTGSSYTGFSQPIHLELVTAGDRWLQIDGFFYLFDAVSCPSGPAADVLCSDLAFTGSPSTIYSGEEVTFSISGGVISSITGIGISFGDEPLFTYDLSPWDTGAVSRTTGHTYTSGGTYTGTFTYSTGGGTQSCTTPVTVERCGDSAVNGTEECDDGGTSNGDGCDSSCQTELPSPVCVDFSVTATTGYDLLDISSITCTGNNASGYIINILSGGEIVYTGTGGPGASYTDSPARLSSGGSYDVLCTITGHNSQTSCSVISLEIAYCGDGTDYGNDLYEVCEGQIDCIDSGQVNECTRDDSEDNGGSSSTILLCENNPNCSTSRSRKDDADEESDSDIADDQDENNVPNEDNDAEDTPDTNNTLPLPNSISRTDIKEAICMRNEGSACGFTVIDERPRESEPPPVQHIYGCSQEFSCNRNPLATIDDGSCIPPRGCNDRCPGELGSIEVDDACGVCGGDGSSCEDCAGVPNGGHQIDSCGSCLLPSDPQFGKGCSDCAGVPNGKHIEDACGQCLLPDSPDLNICVDCMGEPFGIALIGSDCNDRKSSTVLDHRTPECSCEGLLDKTPELPEVKPDIESTSLISVSFTKELRDLFSICTLSLPYQKCIVLTERYPILPEHCVAKKLFGRYTDEAFVITRVENFDCDQCDDTCNDTSLVEIDDFSNNQERVPGTLYVEITDGSSMEELKQLLENKFTQVTVEQPFASLAISTLKISAGGGGKNPNDIVSLLQNQNRIGVEIYHPEPIFSVNADSSNGSTRGITSFLSQIGWERSPKACELIRSNVTVAVVDNAFETTHEDLQKNIVYSYDVTDNDTNVAPPSTDSSWNHGSVTAGIIGADTENGLGVDGVSNNTTQLILIKATADNAQGDDITAGIEGIAKAIELEPDIISISWGKQFVGSVPVLEKLIEKAHQKGIIVVASAGNGNNSKEFYPAAYKDVIAVAAMDEYGTKAEFSNYGTRVDVAAPGTNITSTTLGNSYSVFDGTSEATAIVAGTIGRSLAHGITYEELLTSSTPVQPEWGVGKGIIRMPSDCGDVQEHGAATPGEYFLKPWESILLGTFFVLFVGGRYIERSRKRRLAKAKIAELDKQVQR